MRRPDPLTLVLAAALATVVAAGAAGIAHGSDLRPDITPTSYLLAGAPADLSTPPPLPTVHPLVAATVGGPPAPPCTSAQLRASFAGGGGSLGEVTIVLDLTNEAPTTCSLHGYPRVVLTAGGRTLPFTYVHGGSYIGDPGTAVPTVTLARGTTASVFVAKYRCDSGAGSVLSADTALLTPPRAGSPLSVSVYDDDGSFPYCWSELDPGHSTVEVGPVEPLVGTE